MSAPHFNRDEAIEADHPWFETGLGPVETLNTKLFQCEAERVSVDHDPDTPDNVRPCPGPLPAGGRCEAVASCVDGGTE